MFRVATNISLEAVPWRYKSGSSRLYKTVKHYSQKNICPPKPRPPPNSGAKYTIGAIALLTGATIGYAKYDPDFRKLLTENVPYSDDVIKFVFQEEKSILTILFNSLNELKDALLNFIGATTSSRPKDIPITSRDYKPPGPLIPAIEKEMKKDETYTEIRVADKQDEVAVGGYPKVVEDDSPTDLKNLADIEMKICETAKVAIESYDRAICALKNYNTDVAAVIEDSVERLDPKIWASLDRKTKAKNEAIVEAEKNAAEAQKLIQELRDIVNKKSFEASDLAKEQLKNNIKKIYEDIANAKKDLEHEKAQSHVTERYWNKVEQARKHFAKELEIIFPSLRIDEKKLKLSESEIDLFVLHTFSNILFYQKELAKLETITDARIRTIMEAARKGNPDIISDAQIMQEVEKERRHIQKCYQQQCLQLRTEGERDLRCQLKLQSEAFSDHLKDALKSKEMEVERTFARKFDEEIEKERCKYKMQLSAMIGRMKGMDYALKAQVEAEKGAKKAQVLWSACQALFRAVRAGCPGLPWQEQIRPLAPEILAVKQASAEGDELVKAVLNGIPKEALVRGVYPEDALRERFLKVEKVARQVALVPEGGARLPIYLLSYIQSLLLVNAATPIPQAELSDEVVDFSKLNTNEILQRARYWLDRGDFAQTLRYMNLLKGAPRSVASQWMNETRILLETQQAANTLMAHAASTGLTFL